MTEGSERYMDDMGNVENAKNVTIEDIIKKVKQRNRLTSNTKLIQKHMTMLMSTIKTKIENQVNHILFTHYKLLTF